MKTVCLKRAHSLTRTSFSKHFALCWTAITTRFAVETVEKCVEETLTGDLNDPHHVTVAPAELRAGLAACYPVTRKEPAALVIGHPNCMMPDDGEKRLFALLLAGKLRPGNDIVVTTADKAAWVASNGLGWLNSMTSLENLARKAGVGRVSLDALALQYREDWLSVIKTKIMLGIIP